MGILVFGIGLCYRRYRFWLEKLDVTAFLDNDPAKQGREMFGHPVYVPAQIRDLDFSAVFVLGKYKNEMKKELLALGIEENRIFSEDDIESALKQKWGHVEPEVFEPPEREGAANRNGILKKGKKNVLLCSHDLSISGAPLALLNVAKVLQKQGCAVTVATGVVVEGDLRSEYAKLGVPVVYDFRMGRSSFRELQWIDGFDLILVNTSVLCNLFSERLVEQAPVIWWLHEPRETYDSLHGFTEGYLRNSNWNNVHVYGVSEVAIRAFRDKCSSPEKIDVLLPGLEDFRAEKVVVDQEKPFVFALIGALMENKSQDVFLQAVGAMPEEVRKRCVFWLIGRIDSDRSFSQKVQRKVASMKEVVLCGHKSREEMKTLWMRINAVVVPSREETLSLAAVEGMMNQAAVICSDENAIGIARYVREAKAGLLVPPGDVNALSIALTWIVQHPQECKKMGEHGRRVYEENFSLLSLERSMNQIVAKNCFS